MALKLLWGFFGVGFFLILVTISVVGSTSKIEKTKQNE